MTDPRWARVTDVISQVLRSAVASTGASGIALAHEDSSEYELARRCCVAAVGEAGMAAAGLEVLSACSWNKTALLLTRAWPHELLLPLGDLWASEIASLTGRWSGPPDVLELVGSAGGIEAAEGALKRWLHGREPVQDGLSDLPAGVRGPFLEAVRRGRLWRERSGLVPKLSARTIGIDLFA